MSQSECLRIEQETAPKYGMRSAEFEVRSDGVGFGMNHRECLATRTQDLNLLTSIPSSRGCIWLYFFMGMGIACIWLYLPVNHLYLAVRRGEFQVNYKRV